MERYDNAAARDRLVRSLAGVYRLEAFGALAEMLQGESLVLQYLAEHREEPVFPSVLSEACRLSRSRITGTLNSLRRKGFLELENDSRDRRMVRVCITAEGLAFIRGKLERVTAYFDKMIAGVGAADACALAEVIDRCVAVMED